MSQPARDALIDVTARLLETQGYHGTGLNQIIKQSGAPRGSLYYYFPNGKEELAAAAITQRAAAFADFAKAGLAEREEAGPAILHFIDQVIEHFAESDYCGGAPLAAVALETASTSDRLRAACADAYAQLHAPFANKLEAAGCDAAEAASLALFINAAMEGAVVLSRAQRSTEPLRQVRAQIARVLAYIEVA
jgi:TetR/AcrR family transcriptional repressor of lmrAB and yxaGH operons